MENTAKKRLTPEVEHEIQRRANSATPGPWAQMNHWRLFIVPAAQCDWPRGASVNPVDDARYAHPIAEVRAESKSAEYPYDYEQFPHRRYADQQNVIADAEFIAHARFDIPALLEELRAVRKELDEAQNIAAQWQREYDRAVRATQKVAR